jgi:GGDEF domain-containing protein
MNETGAEAALSVVARIQSLLEEQMQKNRWPITTSIGLVTCLKPPPSTDRLIQMADEQMYFCKRAGKDCIHSTIFTG